MNIIKVVLQLKVSYPEQKIQYVMLLPKVSTEQTGPSNVSDIIGRHRISDGTITSLTGVIHAFPQSLQANPRKIPTVHKPGYETVRNVMDAHAQSFVVE
jgi:hypothetical protein